MKHLIQSINPKNLFRSKSKHISKSAPPSFNTSFSASTSSSDASDAANHHRRSDFSVLDDLIEAFKLIDRDGDGKIAKRDLQTILTRIGATEADLTAMLAESALGPDDLKEAFDVFDADHDGKITAEELLRVFVSIGDERCTLDECRRMIDSVDVNGDGFVCFADFSRMMMVQQQQ